MQNISSYRYSDGYNWIIDSCSVFGTSGSLWTWGSNSCGSIGDGTTVNRCSPGTVAGDGSTWCKVSGQLFFSTAIKTDGTLWTWGRNSCGELGDGTTTSRSSPGTIAGKGKSWCHISALGCSMSAIKTDGTLWTWGWNNLGRLGDGTTVDKCSPGTIAGGGTTWVTFSAGGSHVAAIKTDGTLWTWGKNSYGQLGDGTTIDRCSPGTIWGSYTTWSKVFGGSNHSASIKTDGTLWTWGCNYCGKLGNGTTVSRCSPGTVAGGGTTWCMVSGFYNTSAAIKTDGTIWTWGCNGQGILGDGTTVNRSSPGTIFGDGITWCSLNTVCSTAAIKTKGF